MTTTFTTTILGFGNNAGIEVPALNLAELGAGKRAQVIVHIEAYSFKSTLGNMAGITLISFSKAHREASGLKAGDRVVVKLELDSGYREVEIPIELKAALAEKDLEETFTKLVYSKRKEFCRQVTDAKSQETKVRRIEKIVAEILRF
jgi:hypothetical protein